MENHTHSTSSVQDKLSPNFFFISLGVIASLIASVTSFINLVFATLDKKFPDVLNATYQYGYNFYDYASIRSALATLIIIFPVFLILSHFWNKMVKGQLGHVNTIIKKWMLYLIVFLASIVVVVDLITLVDYFVQGEITIRFIWKVVTVIVVAKIAGVYYLYKLREGRFKKIVANVYPWLAIILVAAAIAWSFTIMGSPAKQRLLRLDDRRVQDLQSIQYQVINYYQQKEKLPDTLKDLANPLSGNSLPVDPEFEKGVKYEYIKTANLSFQLCATFAEPIPKGWVENGYYGRGVAYPMAVGGSDGSTTSMPVKDMLYPYPGGGTNESWDHQAGRTCFDRTIDPQMYPPYNPRPL